jgi:excisionase family DNA binding protein
MISRGAYLSTAEVAEQCGVSARTVSRWVDAGVLPAVFTTGGHRRVLAHDVERFLENRRSLRSTQGGQILILVFSNDSDAIQALKKVCRNANSHLIIEAPTDPFSCGVLVGGQAPDLLVLDSDLELNVLDLCATIKHHPRTQSSYLLVLIPGINPNLCAQLLHAQADAVLSKPVDAAACRHSINMARHRRSTR